MLVAPSLPATHPNRIFECQSHGNIDHVINQAASSIVHLIGYALLGFQYWFRCMILSIYEIDRQLCNKTSGQLLTNRAMLTQDPFHSNQATRKQKFVPYSTCEAEAFTAAETGQSMQFIRNVLSVNSGG